MRVLSQSSLCSQWQSGWGTPQVGITSSLARSLSQMPDHRQDHLFWVKGHRHPTGTALPFLVWLPPTHGSVPSSLRCVCHSQRPLPPRKKLKRQPGRTHTKFYWGGGAVFTEAGRREGSHGVGEIVGTRQTMGYRMTPAPTPTPGRAGEQLGPRKTG